MGLRTRVWRSLFPLLLVLSVLIGLPPAPAKAFPSKLTPNGQTDFDYGSLVDSDGSAATGYKPESKLFSTFDGATVRWWAILGTSGPSPPAGVRPQRSPRLTEKSFSLRVQRSPRSIVTGSPVLCSRI